ncbi:MAG: hypothetical protein HDT21_11005 [Ruminococcus sp.]|nr:hypothetical protein [Ruminococcus sp.]
MLQTSFLSVNFPICHNNYTTLNVTAVCHIKITAEIFSSCKNKPSPERNGLQIAVSDYSAESVSSEFSTTTMLGASTSSVSSKSSTSSSAGAGSGFSSSAPHLPQNVSSKGHSPPHLVHFTRPLIASSSLLSSAMVSTAAVTAFTVSAISSSGLSL